MNKSHLIEALPKKRYMPAKLAADIVNLVFDGFTNALKNGDKIEIRGFGSFGAQGIWRLQWQESENR